MRVLISGAGIAGPCLAYWLSTRGFEPTLVERAPRLRSGGYIVDFWGAGFDVAERMGITSQLLERGYKVRQLREVDQSGTPVSELSMSAFDRMTDGRYTSLPRSVLSECLYEALGDYVETIFGDSVSEIEASSHEVRVRFERNEPRAFDVVVGADGLHSRVRQLAFGRQARFEHFLGMKVAAFTVEGYRPRDELVYVIHRDVGCQVGRFSMRDDRTMFLFVFRAPAPQIPESIEGQKALLRERFSDVGWECPRILEALDRSDDLYLDRVSQIRMEHWTQGRVALVGDAACCVSLLAGQGSALAMVEAYVLAGELERANGDYAIAFTRYEQRLGAFLRAKQKAALKFASFFAPRSRLDMFVGQQVLKLMALPFVTDLAVGRDLRDRIEIAEY